VTFDYCTRFHNQRGSWTLVDQQESIVYITLNNFADLITSRSATSFISSWLIRPSSM